MSFCTECGNKIEGEYRFCPECGTQLNRPSTTDNDPVIKESESVIICNNCGEENTSTNNSCFSCGITLKGFRTNYPESVKRDVIITGNINKRFESTSDSKRKPHLKVFDNKKVFFISISIIVLLILALLPAGVFESGINTDITGVSNQPTDFGVDLKTLNEIADLENKVKANPDDLESVLHLAQLLQDSRFYDKAITNYRKYLDKFPDDSDARVDLGICYYNLHDFATAIKEMEKAITYKSSHQIAHLNLGIVNLTAGNVNASKDWFRKTVALNPDSEAGKRAQELLNTH